MRHIRGLFKTVTCWSLVVFLSVMIIGVTLTNQAWVSAQSSDEIQREIDALTEEIESSENKIDRLQNKKDTLENRLETIKVDIEKTQVALERTKSKITSVQQRIKETKQELARKKEQIQENAKILYKNGDPSTLEILFSSDNFSDFISRREYLQSAKDSLNKAAEETKQLQSSLEEEKAELAVLKREQQSDKNALQHKKEKQQEILKKTRGKEERYQDLRDRQKAERKKLEEQQRQAYAEELAAARASNQFVSTGNQGNSNGNSNTRNSTHSYAGTNSYPWASASTSAVDKWGLYARQCVSYTAWKVESTGRFVPHFAGRGHANQWASTTSSHGISSGRQPKAGAVAVNMNIQPYGHTMYVEEVLDGGSRIRISEYNLIPYQYSERVIPASGLVYIYF